MAPSVGHVEVRVTARGRVSDDAQRLAHDEVGRLDHYVKGPVMDAHVVLTQEENPRIAFPARAEGEITLPGRTVRARTAGPSMNAAVDDLAERLQDQLRRFVDRLMTRQREPAESSPGEWRHGSRPAVRPKRSFRPPQERRIERRKVFAVGPMSVEEAALEIDALDHEFFLFRNAEKDGDSVLYRRDDGSLAVIDQAGARQVDLRSAVDEMDELNHHFLFFVNEQTGRGNVIYLRFDGHYGLIEPGPGAGPDRTPSDR